MAYQFPRAVVGGGDERPGEALMRSRSFLVQCRVYMRGVLGVGLRGKEYDLLADGLGRLYRL